MKLDDIEDPEMRADLNWACVMEWEREAASLHPNWRMNGAGHLIHNGKRTGPRTPHTLLN